MNTLKKYKKEIRRMFFISIEKDISSWWKSGNMYYSPVYDNFQLEIENKCLYLHKDRTNRAYILRYRKKIFRTIPIILDFKVWWCIIKLDRYLKKEQIDKQNSREIEYLNEGLSKISQKYVKEIRKEKLNQINKV